MAVTINANFNKVNGAVIPGNNETTGSKKSFNASGLNIGFDVKSQVELRKERAREQAMRLVGDAWEKDRNADSKLSSDIAKRDKNQLDIYAMRDKVNELEKTHDGLMEAYGVDVDSAEQKDLELLEKYQNNKRGASFDMFSEDELKRLQELKDAPLTDYQRKALELNSEKLDLNEQIWDKKVKNFVLDGDIDDALQAQLKNQNMQRANAAADEIMDAASRDVVGMLIQDVKDKLDEKTEEEKEKADELAEAKEEQQEELEAAKEIKTEQELAVEKAKEEKKEQEELLESVLAADVSDVDIKADKVKGNNVELAIRNIDKLLKDNNLINEDIKGIEIDLDF